MADRSVRFKLFATDARVHVLKDIFPFLRVIVSTLS